MRRTRKIQGVYVMKDKPTVTIGICSRNEKHTIEHAIDSVLAQDYPHELMEIIFVDDSEDETFSIIQNYTSKIDLNVKVFRGSRKGLGIARNLVIDNAKGDYIVWADADIMIPPDHVRKQVIFMQQNSKVGIAKARFYPAPQKGLVPTLENLEFMATEYIVSEKKTQNIPCYLAGGSIYRTEAIRQIRGFDTGITGAGEDEEIEWRMAGAGWLVHTGTDAFYFEWRKQTLKALWNNHFWYGYGAHYLYHKKVRTVKFFNLLSGFLFSSTAYHLTHRKVSFLLLIQYYFKRIAWFFGLTKAHLVGYGHD